MFYRSSQRRHDLLRDVGAYPVYVESVGRLTAGDSLVRIMVADF